MPALVLTEVSSGEFLGRTTLLKSSLGFHLVNVFNKTPMKQMTLDNILSEVKRDYYDQLRKKDTETIISNKILEYQIIDNTEIN